MADLTFLERTQLEHLFGMGGGYVLDFSNRTFREFIAISTGRDISDQKYNYASGSKANRLRAFWRDEPNHVVGKLLSALLDSCNNSARTSSSYEACSRIAQRLLEDSPLQEVEAIPSEEEFEVLAKTVKDAIEKNEPESGLDRLHTFMVKYTRRLCEKHGITVGRDKALHSLFGEYVKRLKQSGRIESKMTERILKSSISILEAFNEVRNEQSLAHDNPVLNFTESLLIFKHVTSSIRFIEALETDTCETSTGPTSEQDAEISF